MAEKIAPPSAPMLTEAPSPAKAPEPDDIPEPVVPPEVTQAITTPPPPTPEFGEHEALLSGFCQALQKRIYDCILDEHKGIMRTMDGALHAMQGVLERLGHGNEHAQYQLSDALAKLQERGVLVVQNPYKAIVHATSPQGFPVALEICKRDAVELTQAIEGLTAWLQTSGYTSHAEVPA